MRDADAIVTTHLLKLWTVIPYLLSWLYLLKYIEQITVLVYTTNDNQFKIKLLHQLSLLLFWSCSDNYIVLWVHFPCHVQGTLSSSRHRRCLTYVIFSPLMQFSLSLYCRSCTVDVWTGAGHPMITFQPHWGRL